MFLCNRLDPTSSSNVTQCKKVWERRSHPTTPLFKSDRLVSEQVPNERTNG